MKWKTKGKYHNFINDTLVKDTSELLNYLTEFNNVFRWQPSGNTAHRESYPHISTGSGYGTALRSPCG